MEFQAQEGLTKFIDKYWPIVKEELTKKLFINIRDGIFTRDLKADNPEKGVNDILFIVTPMGAHLYGKDMLLCGDEKFNCQTMVYKINDQRIPIFISEDFEEAVQKLKENFHFLVDDSSTKNWKFAVASNYEKWIFFGKDTMIKEAPLCSSEIFHVRSVSKRKLLEPFLRTLLTVFRFDARELYQIDKENREKHKLKMKGASFEDLTNDIIEKWKKIGGEKAENAIEFIKKWQDRRAARRNKIESEKEKPPQEESK